MNRMIVLAGLFALTLVMSRAASADTLKVGPDQKFAKVSEAVKAAKDGDVIEIAPGEYVNDWAKVRANDLVIRGLIVDGKRPQLITRDAMIDNGKAFLVAMGNNIIVENIEFISARVADQNGSGIRAEGKGTTIRNCRFYDCEDGINGGIAEGEILVEYCEFDHCGHSLGKIATHSIYIFSTKCTKLTFRYNYSHNTLNGHLLKSRAKETWVLYNRLTDEDGEGSAVADLPDGGLVVMIGNVLHKGPNGKNNRMIMFGSEGLKHERNEIYVVNNSMWWDNRRPEEMAFVKVMTQTAGPKAATSGPDDANVKAVIRNNVCVGVIPLTNFAKAQTAGNLLFKTVAEAGFVDPATYDFHLKAGSPCIDKGDAADPGKVDGVSLKPDLQYLHPRNKQPRPDDGKLDVGAFEFTPAK
jgi:hypothetical protein